MPREAVPFAVPDLSVFARSLGRALAERGEAKPPSHVELLNLIARAAGHRNFQAMRASSSTSTSAVAPATVSASAPASASASSSLSTPEGSSPSLQLSANASKALRQFDREDRLLRWPTKFSIQRLALWILWTRFDSHRVYTEKEVNAVLKNANAFGDHVILRRELIDHRLLTRKDDCSEYRKLPAQPDSETRALLDAWRTRRSRA